VGHETGSAGLEWTEKVAVIFSFEISQMRSVGNVSADVEREPLPAMGSYRAWAHGSAHGLMGSPMGEAFTYSVPPTAVRRA